ncbi:MAG: hypothetical protein V4793_12720, partial [Paraburkholderia tropica]
EAHAARRDEVSSVQAERDAAASELQNVQTQVASLTEERDAGATEIARLSATVTEAQERAAELSQLAENAAAEAAANAEAIAKAEQAVKDAQEAHEALQAQAQAQAEEAQAEEAQAAASAPQEAPQAAQQDTAAIEALETLKAQFTQEAQTHAAAINEARDNLKKWADYANGLKQQLIQSNEQMMLIHARGVGEASLSRRLAGELSQLKPDHELLRKEFQQRVIVEAISAQLEAQGYRYDASTAAVTKLNAENASA